MRNAVVEDKALTINMSAIYQQIDSVMALIPEFTRELTPRQFKRHIATVLKCIDLAMSYDLILSNLPPAGCAVTADSSVFVSLGDSCNAIASAIRAGHPERFLIHKNYLC